MLKDCVDYDVFKETPEYEAAYESVRQVMRELFERRFEFTQDVEVFDLYQHTWLDHVVSNKSDFIKLIFLFDAIKDFGSLFFSYVNTERLGVMPSGDDISNVHSRTLKRKIKSFADEETRDHCAIRDDSEHPLTELEHVEAFCRVLDHPEIMQFVMFMQGFIEAYFQFFEYVMDEYSCPEERSSSFRALLKKSLSLAFVNFNEQEQWNQLMSRVYNFFHRLTQNNQDDFLLILLPVLASSSAIDGKAPLKGSDLTQGMKRMFGHYGGFKSRLSNETFQCPWSNATGGFAGMWNMRWERDDDGIFRYKGQESGGFFNTVMSLLHPERYQEDNPFFSI